MADLTKQRRPRYYVMTWDCEREEWTPQKGVRTGPYSLWSLRKAIRQLRALGYSCHYRSWPSPGPGRVARKRTRTPIARMVSRKVRMAAMVREAFHVVKEILREHLRITERSPGQ